MAEASLLLATAGSDDKSSTSSKSSAKSSKSRSKTPRKDDFSALSDRVAKQDERFSSLEGKLETLLTMLTSQKCDNNETRNAALGERESNSTSVNETPLCGSQTENCENLNDFQQPAVRSRPEPDEISLFVGENEKHDCGFSIVSESVSHMETSEDSDRFVKYLNPAPEVSDKSIDPQNCILTEKFGSDATTSKSKSNVGIRLEKNQIDILNDSWRCTEPAKVSSYRDIYKNTFPVSSDFEDCFKVPLIDNTVEALLVNRHGRTASFGRTPALHSKHMKSVEKLAYFGQLASRMGMISTCYIQQALGSLLDTLQTDNLNVDRAVQTVRDIFAMTTKTLDQVARAGAFHHLVRRNATLIDTGLCDYKEYSAPVMSLPLTADGVFGTQFDKKLKEKSELSKNLAEVLPEGLRKSMSNSYKRKSTAGSGSSQTKKPRTDDYKSRPGSSHSYGSGQSYKPAGSFKIPLKSKAVSSFRKSTDSKKF